MLNQPARIARARQTINTDLMTKHMPKPFELATLAATLATKSNKTPESFFEQALELLKLSANRLKRATKSEKEEWDEFLVRRGMKMYCFKDLLKQSDPMPGHKKGKTMVGYITTRKGLFKAIRRVLPIDLANRIIENGYLVEAHRQLILLDQEKRNASKTQAANKAKKKSVK